MAFSTPTWTNLSWTNLSLRIKALIVVSLPVGALVLSMILIGWAAREKNHADEEVKHALEIRAQLQNMFIILISAESEVRSFALTGHEEGLQSFAIAEASVDVQFNKIRDLMLKDPEEGEKLTRLQRLVHQRVAALKELRAYYGSPEARQAPPPAQLVASAKMSPDVLLPVTEMFTNQAKVFQERSRNAEDRQTRLRAAVAGSVLAGLIGGVLAALLFTRGISRRIQRLENSASNLKQGLSVEPALAGKDELGRLGTALQRTSEILAAQREELKLALEGAELLIWELEAGSGRIRYQAGSGVLPNANFPEEILPDTVERWLSGLREADRGRVRQELSRITAEAGSFQIEYPVVIRGGEVRWLLVKAQSHAAESSGGRRLLGVLADISARKKASEEIERQAHELIRSREAFEQQTRILQSILDSMGDGVVVADTSGKFLVFNPAARQMLGSRSFAGDPSDWAKHYGLFLPDTISLYPPDQLPFLRAIRGESVDGAEIFVRPAGAAEGVWVSVTARPVLEDDGKILGGVVVIRNVTAARHAAEALKGATQEAEQANHAKSEFLSRMSHELRTPLNSILGFAQLLELGELSDQQGDNIRHILKGGYHLLDLINEILDLARIESGRISLSSEPVPVSEVLKDALDLVRPMAIQEGVSIMDGGLKCRRHVQADRQRLKQVLLNLLSNAIKFNRPGGSVLIACSEITDGERLRIEVTDTGSGISPDGLKRLFKPFERLQADTTEVSGTGLGLALSKRLMEAMRGSIGVESAVGLGSRFFIELSLIADPVNLLESDTAAAALMSSSAQRQRGTILYIEDNTSNLRLVEQILIHRPGVRLLSAMQGQLGLDLAELHRPDWILLDIHLPDIPGDEVLRRLRLNPRTRGIPVTVLSADATPGQIHRLKDAGARDYLTKPLDVRKLLYLLEQNLRRGEPYEDELPEAYADRDHSK